MMLSFDKYQGAGNDFIIIDARNIEEEEITFTEKTVNKLCDRNFGIGADGLILLLESEKFNFRMKYFNSDGKEGSMCGNGGRCIVAFAKAHKIIGNETDFEGIDGMHTARILDDENISLKMTNVNTIKEFEDGLLLETGSPHFVIPVDSVDDVDVFKTGKKIRHEQRFGKKGVNVNFVEYRKQDLKIRTFERGVENETLACGTGAVAAAISAYFNGNTDKSSCLLHARGGNLKVDFTAADKITFHNVWLTGPAEFVFEGKISI